MKKLPPEELKILAEGHTIVPVSVEIFSDVRTPIQILKSLQEKSSQFYILESVESGESWGRYTFLGYDPSALIYGLDGVTTIEMQGKKEISERSAHEVIGDFLKKYKSPKVSSLPPFTGGLVGYFAYEYVKYVEKNLVLNASNPHGFLDFHLMLFDKVIAFDHFRQKIYLIVNIETRELEKNYSEALLTLEKMKELVFSCVSDVPCGESAEISNFKANFSEAQYCEMVETAKKHIFEGDIFQVVLSNRLEADFSGDSLWAYRKLRTVNPSPYMFYINFDNMQIAGASPETLVSLKDGALATYPLAGTCRRGETQAEDEELINALLTNE
ncbi:anthranilate synthase component I, partial [Candidatus Gastranaerophilus sp. (ex Termes propinquus)]